MTGLDGRRVYLDWNASAPLRSEARDAMLSAMDALGNPSSVHAEGRKAKAILERARAQVADLVGCEQSEVVFTSGATEAASLALSSRTVIASDVEHDCIHAHRSKDAGIPLVHGRLDYACKASVSHGLSNADDVVLAFQAANSETGVVHDFAGAVAHYDAALFFRLFVDLAQTAGRIPLTYRHDGQSSDTCWRPLFSVISGHKFGSSPGVGALIVDTGYAEHEDVEIGAMSVGGGQEQGRRAGTENVIGIAGFGAAAEAAKRDLEAGVWDGVAELRNILENTLEDAAPDLTIFGRDAPRLPNTTCFAVPGWAGETQVMQMDLAGFAVSAGSACSSGKVARASRVLLAMGFDKTTASSAIRVSIGPTTTEAEVMAFADAWIAAHKRWKAKAA